MKTKQAFNYTKENPVPNFEGGVLDESLIMFGGGHCHVDPKVGLGLYGPYSNPEQRSPSLKSMSVGIIGPSAMISDAQQWLTAIKGALINDGSQPFLYPHFPGLNEEAPFQCELVNNDTWNESFVFGELEKVLNSTEDFFTRIDLISKLYTQRLEIISQREPRPNVVLCCIPQEVIDLCTVRENRTGEVKRIKFSDREKKLERRKLKFMATGQLDIFNQVTELLNDEEPFVHQNLRRGIKAESMKFGIPTQLVWPRTLALSSTKSKVKEKSSQDIATRAWNFSTALYYKSGGSPWRLHKLDQGVCFIGISFYRDIKDKNSRMRTSMAQTFTAAGDGYVLRGNTFEWNESLGKSPHLDQNSAHTLIQRVLDLYKSQNRGRLPGRIVVHKSSKFWDEELKGFKSACELVPRKDFVAFGRRGIQFYRPGDYPPVRGTYIKFSNDNFLLYTVGYTPFLKSYNGPRVPMPLEVVQYIGDSPWLTMLTEVLALTKMNWNTADFACAQPITTAFSQKVGLILAELPEDYPVRSEYRFYM